MGKLPSVHIIVLQKERDKMRDGERQRETERDRERQRETERDRERQRETERDRERQRETERDKEGKRDTERDKEGQRLQNKSLLAEGNEHCRGLPYAGHHHHCPPGLETKDGKEDNKKVKIIRQRAAGADIRI